MLPQRPLLLATVFTPICRRTVLLLPRLRVCCGGAGRPP